jgi:hypothetical protein
VNSSLQKRVKFAARTRIITRRSFTSDDKRNAWLSVSTVTTTKSWRSRHVQQKSLINLYLELFLLSCSDKSTKS